jgi:hypothetical protein
VEGAERWSSDPPGGPVPAGLVGQPSRCTVASIVAERCIAGGVLGGGILGGVYLVAAAVGPSVAEGRTDRLVGGPFFLLLGCVGGAAFGLVVGAVAAPVVGLGCAVLTVPYRGARTTLAVSRCFAVLVVLVFLGFFSLTQARGGGRVYGPALLLTAGVAGAWLVGGWTTRWYVARMEPGLLRDWDPDIGLRRGSRRGIHPM